jgi:diacylglycerol O-acyltransferase / wax synthase
MPQEALRRRMRGADAIFVYFERKEMPLHIGSVAVLDGDFPQECERLIEARLPEIPRYRQRLMFRPMNIAHPSWEFDPEFDIRNHIRRVRLEPPGSDAQLSALSGQIFTPLMDRNRPLWDLTVIDGLEGGRSALVSRVHHCMVDGVSGIALMNIMFDASKAPRPVRAVPYDPPPLPDSGQLFVEGLASGWADAAERLIDMQIGFLRIAQAFVGDAPMASLKSLATVMPELMRPTERLPFNGPCSGVRGHCWTTFSFAETRAIRSALGGTINDVALAAVTGAVTRYVLAHREPVKGRFIRYMVPVNLRTEDPRGSTGNEVSMLPLSVPLDILDPVERMKAITVRSMAMKTARVADMVALIGAWLGWTPPVFQTSLAALPFLPQPVPIINMVCTNVPGPMIPLYANGRELLTYYPHVPCGSDVGIGVAIQSYNQKLHYGVTYDMQAAPDGDLFRDFLVESYEELRSAAGVAPLEITTERARPARPPVEDLRAHRADRKAEPATAPEAVQQPLEPPPLREAIKHTPKRVRPAKPALERPAPATVPKAARKGKARHSPKRKAVTV